MGRELCDSALQRPFRSANSQPSCGRSVFFSIPLPRRQGTASPMFAVEGCLLNGVGRRVAALPAEAHDGERADGLPHHARVSAFLLFFLLLIPSD